QFSDGWSYRVDLPDLISHDHYLSAMTHIIVLELANRNADGRSAEIPLWLREGLARQLLSNREAELIPRIPQWNVNGVTVSPIVTEGRRTDPLARAHDLLKATPALTFQELSWPSSDDLRGEPGEQFRSSAQLFVARLLAMKNGHNSFGSLIENLSQYYNWQLALLKAYSSQFSSTLDVEKWWAMNVVQFTGHDLNQAWTEEESLRQLEETVRPPVEVRTATNQMPMHTDTSLQTIITDWKKSQRDDTLQQVINELAVLRFRLASNVAAVADSYQNTLVSYLKARDQFDDIPEARRRSTVSESSLTRATLKKLDSLDAQCKTLQPSPKRVTHNTSSASLDTNWIKSIVP
ncbi:MAG TPA: hypothetical protein VH255_07705, partial [Verrucomicrobiae bacterium]|nr:hypothetical protein [Verrucomicrobiae bacterium]